MHTVTTNTFISWRMIKIDPSCIYAFLGMNFQDLIMYLDFLAEISLVSFLQVSMDLFLSFFGGQFVCNSKGVCFQACDF